MIDTWVANKRLTNKAHIMKKIMAFLPTACINLIRSSFYTTRYFFLTILPILSSTQDSKEFKFSSNRVAEMSSHSSFDLLRKEFETFLGNFQQIVKVLIFSLDLGLELFFT